MSKLTDNDDATNDITGGRSSTSVNGDIAI